MGHGAGATHRAPASAVEGEADYHQLASATYTAHHNGHPTETTKRKTALPPVCCSTFPNSTMFGRRVATHNIANCSLPEMHRIQAQHERHRGTTEKPDTNDGTTTKTIASAPPNAASASVDIAAAPEKATLTKTRVAHNSPQAAGEDVSPPAANETADVIAATHKAENPLATYTDDGATAFSSTDFIVPIPSAPAATCAAVKNTTREKIDRSGEAEHELSTIETPKKAHRPQTFPTRN